MIRQEKKCYTEAKPKEENKMTIYTIKGRTSGKAYQLELDDKGDDREFIGHFYGDFEEVEHIDGTWSMMKASTQRGNLSKS
jgi:hypothetical protein